MSTPDTKFASQTDTARAESFTIRRCKLVVVSGPDQGKELVLNKPVGVIGSAPDNMFVVTDRTVSKNHAMLMEASGGYVLKDLGSTNGTLLDGAPVQESLLKFGSTITVGLTLIQYVPAEETVEVTPGTSDAFGILSAKSARMRALFSLFQVISLTDMSLLIEAEPGMELVVTARAVHDASKRAMRLFDHIDCSLFDQDTLERKLFGYEKNAFEGDDQGLQGIFEKVNGGTVFFDAIEALSPDLQSRVLSVLEKRELTRLGGTRPMRINVRVMAGTCKDLGREASEGRFSKDLFTICSFLKINIPPLRERPEDIAVIAARLVTRIAAKQCLSDTPCIALEVMDLLTACSWPGNILQLSNVLSMVIAAGDRIMIKPADFMLAQPAAPDMPPDAVNALEEIQKTLIKNALQHHRGSLFRAVKELGISHTSFYEKMKKYGLQ